MSDEHFPWEPPAPLEPLEERPIFQLSDYVNFLDKHVRMRVSVGGIVIGFFSIVDEGDNLEATTTGPDGRMLVFELWPGPPRTHEAIMTSAQLVAWVVGIIRDGQV